MTTLLLAGWIVNLIYAVKRRTGPRTVARALRGPGSLGLKIVLVLACLPIPGPLDELAGAWALSRITTRKD